ncbi:MAG: minichromosome maintenance protein MCM [Candidatus Aenigmatarchaeota archaeon]
MELVECLDEFLRKRYYNELLKAVKDEQPLLVDFNDLDRFDPIIADQLLEDPETVLNAFQAAVKNVNEKINVRIRNIPERREIRIRNLRTKHLNKFWCISATIKSASEVKPQIFEAIFECPECGTQVSVPQDGNIVQKPDICECGRRGDFKFIDKRMLDVRWLTGIEPFEVTTGEQPGEIKIFLKGDLTTPKMQKKTDPGSRLKVIGVLKELSKRIKGRLSTKVDMYFEANYLEPSDIEFEDLDITDEDVLKILELARNPDIYDILKASIAPEIYGFDEIKESLVLQLFGGVPHVLPNGSRIRGNIHILLTGDPGVGKTALLKLVSSIVPRGRYVSGSGVSGAGLTATVRKDEILGTWVLEAGALILCNKGLIAIDEFDKMSKDDQIAMHEATSVETVSIAKASIIATLPAQTAVLAGANPKLGRFDPFLPILEQISIPETLMTRFDLKFALRDIPDKTVDERLAEHIIVARTTPDAVKPMINVNLLRKYIAYSKKIEKMELLAETAQLLKNFYIDMRTKYTSEEAKTVSITLRQYEALLRLAEASAKIRLEDRITMSDAERAIRLMKFSLSQLAMEPGTGIIDIDRIESGITATKRRKIGIVLEIIENLQKESKEVAREDIKASCEEQGIDDAEDILEKLKREGLIFEPRAGFVRKV